MPVLLFDGRDKVFNDTRFLLKLPEEVYSDLISLSIILLIEPKKSINFKSAASKIGISPQVLKEGIEALSYIFLETTRLNLNESDFTTSIAQLAFPSSLSQLLSTTFTSSRTKISNILTHSSIKDIPEYSSFSWRLDLIIDSKTISNTMIPQYICELKTSDDKVHTFQSSIPAMKSLVDSLELAIREAKTPNVGRVQRYL